MPIGRFYCRCGMGEGGGGGAAAAAGTGGREFSSPGRCSATRAIRVPDRHFAQWLSAWRHLGFPAQRPAQYGISLALSETSEVLGNLTGGVHRGAEYDGLTQMALQLDTQQAFGWYGGTFRASALQIHGRNLSADNLFTLQTASGIEAEPGARLWELWYQQKFLEEDRADVRIGQMSLDQEFMVTQNGLYFVNTMFGWPMVPSADLPGGGPAYPLSALGVRLRVRPTDSATGLVAVTNGNPAPNNFDDPQKENPSGLSFPLNGGALVIGELQYAYPALGSMVYSAGSSSLSGTYKIGFGTTARTSMICNTIIPVCRLPIRPATGCRCCIMATTASTA